MKSYRKQFIQKRIFIVGSLKIIGLSIIILKFFTLQILNGLKYKKLALNNSKKFLYLINKRGNILDRHGRSFTLTYEYVKLVLFKTHKDYKKITRMVYKILERVINMQLLLQRMETKFKQNKNQGITIAKHITKSELARIKLYQYLLEGVTITKGFSRKYILDNACHVLGYVAKPNKLDIKSPEMKFLSQDEDFKIGKFGLEEILQNQIKDKPTVKILSTNAVGKVMSEEVFEQGENGKDFKTTLDIDLQNKLGELMGEHEGCCTLMDIKTGGILAMQSSPLFDPSKISDGLDLDIFSKKQGSFMNKAISSFYPPGSIFKIISALGALKNGLDPEEKFRCKGEYKIANRVFHCWQERGHGEVNLRSAIAQSCNCYFYHMSKNYVSIDDMYEIGIHLGLGDFTGIELKNEKIPFFFDKEMFKDRYKANWYPGDNANAVIGQGYILVTPIQILTMIARSASGKMLSPTLLKFNETDEVLQINKHHLELVKEGLFDVLNQEKGSLFHRRKERAMIAGKSGSAQVISRSFSKEDIRAGRIEQSSRANSLFVGYAPFHDPKYAVSVVIEHGTWGSVAAAPVGINLLDYALFNSKINA